MHDDKDSMSCNPELIKQMENYLLYIAIGAFIAAALQLVRLLAGKAIRSKTAGMDRFPSNVQWERAYDDMRSGNSVGDYSSRSTPYAPIRGNAGPRDPNAV